MARTDHVDVPRLLLVVLLFVVVSTSMQALMGGGASAGESQSTPSPTASPSPTEQGTGGGQQTALTGTLTTGDEPIEGVTVVARGPDGQEVGEATSDADGSWTIPVPGPGRYEIELVTDTLPEGVELRSESNTRSITILSEGASQRVLFAFGARADVGRQFRRFLQLLANGIRFGLIIAMTAIGLSLIFGTTGLINFAHGDIVTFGAIIAWFWSSGAGIDIHLIPAALIAIAVTGAFSGGLELGLFRPLRKRNVGLFQLLIITIGLSLVIRHILLIFFGGSPRPYTDYTISRVVSLGPIAMTPRDLVLIGLSIVILVAVGLMLLRTKIGKAMRAVSDNRDLAEASGIDVERVILIVWILGGALAATGGIFFGSSIAVDWLMGFQLLLLMFAGVILGGLGTAFGAMVGSLAVGIVTEVSTLWFSSELKFMWGLFVLILVLLVRPQGILGRRERVG